MTVLAPGQAAVGWADAFFSGNALTGKGLGDDDHSYAFDGHTVTKMSAGRATTWGHRWDVGDVIGCALDLNGSSGGAEIQFSLNGSFKEPMGKAFSKVKWSNGMSPCVSFHSTFLFRINYGDQVTHSPFPLSLSSPSHSAISCFEIYIQREERESPQSSRLDPLTCLSHTLVHRPSATPLLALTITL